MLIILSPAKTMNMQSPVPPVDLSIPELIEMAKLPAQILKQKSSVELAELMKVNPKLAQLNFERFQQWHTPFNKDNAHAAVFSYHGEVFNGLEIESFSKSDLVFAQDHLRILSALYGVLRPLDLIQPYRIEMATRLKVGKSKNLYEYWKKAITENINKALISQGDRILINLASNEYYKSIDTKTLNATIITPVFKEYKNEKPVIVTMYAKKARGMMAQYILKNKIDNISALKNFDLDGYYYNDHLSNDTEIIFTR